jgi:hypothetical protein
MSVASKAGSLLALIRFGPFPKLLHIYAFPCSRCPIAVRAAALMLIRDDGPPVSRQYTTK